MQFSAFFERCRNEPTVSDFESYLAYCIFQKRRVTKDQCTVEMASFVRDQAFEGREEKAARLLYDLAKASDWKEGEWEGALR